MKKCPVCSKISVDSKTSCECGRDLTYVPIYNDDVKIYNNRRKINLSKLFITISVLIFIFGFIGGIIIGNCYKQIYPNYIQDNFRYPNSYKIQDDPRIFNVFAMIYVWIGSFLSGLIFFGIGRIISNQELIIDKLDIK